MQKYMLENGTPLVGQEALSDTMKDLIVDTISALVISTAGYIVNKNNARKRNRTDFPHRQNDTMDSADEKNTANK
jgi:hypothetical protein